MRARPFPQPVIQLSKTIEGARRQRCQPIWQAHAQAGTLLRHLSLRSQLRGKHLFIQNLEHGSAGLKAKFANHLVLRPSGASKFIQFSR